MRYFENGIGIALYLIILVFKKCFETLLHMHQMKKSIVSYADDLIMGHIMRLYPPLGR